MAHLCISNSLMVEGVDFSNHPLVNQVIDDPRVFPALLYPGGDTINVSELSRAKRRALAPAGKSLVVFVLDGTWKTARKMLRLSVNLQRLLRLRFEPWRPSAYRIRKQPRPDYTSTIEAIHHLIELLAPADGDAGANSRHNLLEVFDFSINRQLTYIRRTEAP
jgi:DTW domain-containing protein